MKISTLRTVLICVGLSTPYLSLGQTVTLNTKSKQTNHDGALRVELLLNARSDSAPAGLQWEFRIPPGMDIVKIEEGKAAKKAGKTLVCKGAKCLIYGLNRTTIPNGQIAIATIKLDRNSAGRDAAKFGYQPAKGQQGAQIVNPVGASPDGKTINVALGTGSD